MKKRTLKRILKISIPIIIIGVFISTFFMHFKKDKGMTGNEWMMLQTDYIDTLTAYTVNMDEVYALYIAGDMPVTNFITEYALLENEWDVMDAAYEKFLQANTITPGTHSYASQKGEEAINLLRTNIKDILTSTKNENSVISTDKMLYMYLAHKQQAQVYLAQYAVSYMIIKESQNYTEEDYAKRINEIKDEYFNSDASETLSELETNVDATDTSESEVE